jgi:acyl dehydratase
MSSKINVEVHRGKVGTTRRFDFGTITRRQVRRYSRAIEDDNPLYHDVEQARSEGYDDLVIPPNFVPAIIESGEGVPVEVLREDGLDPSRYPIEVPPDVAMIGGGQELTFERYLTAGESVRGEETFDDLYQKEGSSMGTMTFMEMTVEYFVDDERVIRCEKTTIVVDRQ